MPNIKSNSLYSFLGFAVPTVVMMITYPVLVHHLGLAAFGIYVLATSFSGTLSFLELGFSTATLKFIAEDVGKKNFQSAAEVLLSSFVFYTGLGLLIGLIIWIFSPWLASLFSVTLDLQSAAIIVFRLGAIQFVISLWIMVFISLFKGLHRFELSTFALSTLSVMTYGCAIFGVFFLKAGLIGVMATSVGANIVVLFICIIMGTSLCGKKGIKIGSAHFSVGTVRRMLGFGVVMTINSISGIFLYQIQRYLIGVTMGPSSVTVYQLATTIPAKVHAVVNSITEVMFPFASAIKDRARLRNVYLKMLFGSGIIAFIFLMPLIFLAKPILSLWIGPELATQTVAIVPIFALSFFFLALSPAPYHILNGLGKPWYNTISYAFNAFINIGLIGVFYLSGITLIKFAWAFAIANIINSILYQVSVEIFIWRGSLSFPRPDISSQEAEVFRA